METNFVLRAGEFIGGAGCAVCVRVAVAIR